LERVAHFNRILWGAWFLQISRSRKIRRVDLAIFTHLKNRVRGMGIYRQKSNIK